MRRLMSAFLAGAVALGALAAAPAAFAADMVEGVYASDPGACSHPRVLARISSRFDHQVRHVPNLPDVRIDGFHRIGQTRYLPAHESRPVDRRYCNARVALSDGRHRTVWYLIEHPWGYAGVGSSVEFCVSGFDRWYVYNGGCRVLR
jgi:hypothetical protein